MDKGVRNLWCVRMNKRGGGLSQCGHFSDKGEGLIFRDFVHVFYGRPLREKLQNGVKNTFKLLCIFINIFRCRRKFKILKNAENLRKSCDFKAYLFLSFILFFVQMSLTLIKMGIKACDAATKRMCAVCTLYQQLK